MTSVFVTSLCVLLYYDVVENGLVGHIFIAFTTQFRAGVSLSSGIIHIWISGEPSRHRIGCETVFISFCGTISGKTLKIDLRVTDLGSLRFIFLGMCRPKIVVLTVGISCFLLKDFYTGSIKVQTFCQIVLKLNIKAELKWYQSFKWQKNTIIIVQMDLQTTKPVLYYKFQKF